MSMYNLASRIRMAAEEKMISKNDLDRIIHEFFTGTPSKNSIEASSKAAEIEMTKEKASGVNGYDPADADAESSAGTDTSPCETAPQADKDPDILTEEQSLLDKVLNDPCLIQKKVYLVEMGIASVMVEENFSKVTKEALKASRTLVMKLVHEITAAVAESKVAYQL